MLNGATISVVLPCYNEADGLKGLLPRIPSVVDEVVVVDNNSSDGSGDVARQLGARVVHETRQGYGAAYKAGFSAAKSDIIVALDSDGTYPVEMAPELVELLVGENLDFISGCRFPLRDREAMSPVNRLGNWGLSTASALLFRQRVRDSQSGMWIFRRSILEQVKPTSDGMAFSQELKLRAIAAGLRFTEVNIAYGTRVGEVKLNRFKDGAKNLANLGTLWWELRKEA